MDQVFDKATYCLMAAVLVVPEPTTFVVCVLISAGIAVYCTNLTREFMRRIPQMASASAVPAADLPPG